MNKYKIKILRERCTFALVIYNVITEDLRKYYLQISRKDPWYIPRKGTIYKGKITLWGWMYFYVGCNTDMLKK